jgi:hypothetical protein
LLYGGHGAHREREFEMPNEVQGRCTIRLFDEAGEMIEVEGSFGIINGEPTLHIINMGSIPPNFKVSRLEAKPIDGDA